MYLSSSAVLMKLQKFVFDEYVKVQKYFIWLVFQMVTKFVCKIFHFYFVVLGMQWNKETKTFTAPLQKVVLISISNLTFVARAQVKAYLKTIWHTKHISIGIFKTTRLTKPLALKAAQKSEMCCTPLPRGQHYDITYIPTKM